MTPDLAELNCLPTSSAALTYLDLGLSVFPVEPGGKRPATRHGFKDAMTFGEKAEERKVQLRPQVSQLFDEGGFNIGLATGVSVDVLDIDVKDGKPGLRSLRTLQDAGVTAGAVAMAQTPSGGVHLYFPSSGERCRSIGSLGIDWKAAGGYVLASPSRVMILDESETKVTVEFPRYTWTWSRPLSEGEPISWAVVCSTFGLSPSAHEERTWAQNPGIPVEDVVEGLVGWIRRQPVNRNNALHWAVWRAVESGATTEVELEPLVVASLSVANPSDRYDNRELELWATVRSVLRRAGESK